MYRRPKFLEVLLEIRQEMSREADFDVDLFAENVRSGNRPAIATIYDLNVEKESPKENENLKSRKVKV